MPPPIEAQPGNSAVDHASNIAVNSLKACGKMFMGRARRCIHGLKRAPIENAAFTAPLLCVSVNSSLAQAIPSGASRLKLRGYRFLTEDNSSLLGPVVVMSRASVEGSS